MLRLKANLLQLRDAKESSLSLAKQARDEAREEKQALGRRVASLEEQLNESRGVTREAARSLALAEERMALMENEVTENPHIKASFRQLVEDGGWGGRGVR